MYAFHIIWYRCNFSIKMFLTVTISYLTELSVSVQTLKLHCFTTIGQDELNKRITASKTTPCLLAPVPTILLKELLPVAEEPLLNIINFLLSLGHVPKPFKLVVLSLLLRNQN